jgi:hypothetical protein
MAPPYFKDSASITYVALFMQGYIIIICCVQGCTLLGLNTGSKSESRRKIDAATWSMIIEGKTTEADVIDLLGMPKSKTIHSLRTNQ